MDPQDHAVVPGHRAEEQSAPADAVARMLALQQSAGNAAVARMLAPTPAPRSVARDGYAGYDVSEEVASGSGPALDAGGGGDSSRGEEPVLDPAAQLEAAVAARKKETGKAIEKLPTTAPALDGGGPGAYGAEGEASHYTLYGSQPEVEESELSEDEQSELSEDEQAPSDVSALRGNGGPGADGGGDGAQLYELYGGDAAREDAPAALYEPYGGDAAREDAPAALYEAYGGDAAREESEVSEAAPAAAEAAPAAKKKGRFRRAMEAIAKPIKAVGSALKGLGKRLGKGKKKLPSPADLSWGYSPQQDAEEAPPLPPRPAWMSSSSSAASGGGARSRSASAVHPLAVSADEASLSAAGASAPSIKYGQMRKMQGHETESASSSSFFNMLLSGNQLAYDMRRFGLVPANTTNAQLASVTADTALVQRGLREVWGWSEADVLKYYDASWNMGKSTKVEYIASEADLKKYVVHGGSSLTYGDPPQAFDTGSMVSKASGPGYAIFVMDGQGNIYAGQHRVGLFHHSSFLAGRDVAAAGEIKVTGGKLVEITAKSGHYTPTPENTQQVVREMASSGASLSGVTVKLWVPPLVVTPGKKGDPVETIWVDAEEFLVKGAAARELRRGGMV